jgi:FeS assembly SUF system protein
MSEASDMSEASGISEGGGAQAPAASSADSGAKAPAASSADSGAKAPAASSADSGAPASSGADSVRERVIEQLRTIFDPEIPVNIYELGLIYEVNVDDAGQVGIRMTLTSPMCPAAEQLPPEVESKARSVAGVSGVQVDLVWEPTWNPSMMSEAARLDLGMV